MIKKKQAELLALVQEKDELEAQILKIQSEVTEYDLKGSILKYKC